MLKKLLPVFVILGILLASPAYGVIGGFQGGTGFSTSTSGSDGSCLKQASSSPFLTWLIGGCSPATTTINGLQNASFSFLGTANQVTITTSSVNVLTVATPQDIATASKPTFAGFLINGNGTTTNLYVSSTAIFATSTPSGTVYYSNYVDASGFLRSSVTGTSPGNGGVQPYWLWETDCPTVTGVGSATSSECTISQSIPFSDGSRTFVDWTTEQYPPTYTSGWFETASGFTTSSARLYPFTLNMTATDGVHRNGLFNMTPVNPTGTWAGVTFGMTGDTTIQGNITATSTGTETIRIERGATNNFGLLVFATAGTDQWNFGLKNNSTQNFYITDAQNGGDVITAIINGTTTIGNSGSGSTIVLGSATTASTTFKANQTTTLSSDLRVGATLNVTGTSQLNGAVTVSSSFTQSGGVVSISSTTINGNGTTTNFSITSVTSSILATDSTGKIVATTTSVGTSVYTIAATSTQVTTSTGTNTVTSTAQTLSIPGIGINDELIIESMEKWDVTINNFDNAILIGTTTICNSTSTNSAIARKNLLTKVYIYDLNSTSSQQIRCEFNGDLFATTTFYQYTSSSLNMGITTTLTSVFQSGSNTTGNVTSVFLRAHRIIIN